jgi:RHS repeat-associated protein
VLERLSYDAWGKRRNADGTDDPAGSIASQTNRGFTGHEELDSVGLVHMNGRVYDPLLARFGTPDPITESPFSTQGWNRYSYVGNSPLNFTDPSGYCFMGCFWKPIFRAVGSFLRENWGSLVQIAAAAICTPMGLGPVCGALAAAFVTGITSGDLGLALRAGFIAAVTAAAFSFVGTATAGNYVANVAGHAAVGCVSAVASGGKCKSGALSAGLSSAAAPLIGDAFRNARTDMGEMLGGTAASALLGGLGSVAGGGKFGNGAVTGAFGYLFNKLAHCEAGDPTCGPRATQVPFGAGGGGGDLNLGIGAGLASLGTWLSSQLIGANDNAQVTHRNDAGSISGTEVYYLINRGSGEIDKIGITSDSAGRYSQGYLEAENVRYEAQAHYTWRYPAMVDENIRLNFYRFEHGHLPRLNRVTR